MISVIIPVIALTSRILHSIFLTSVRRMSKNYSTALSKYVPKPSLSLKHKSSGCQRIALQCIVETCPKLFQSPIEFLLQKHLRLLNEKYFNILEMISVIIPVIVLTSKILHSIFKTSVRRMSKNYSTALSKYVPNFSSHQ